MPATRWNRSYSDDEEEASSLCNGVEFMYPSVNNGTDHIPEKANDDISALAKRVLADLEAFFDHELLGDDDDGVASQESDTASAERGGLWNGAISLDELSVVLNASIQRHQPVASVVRAQGAPREKKPRIKPDRQMHTKRPQQRHELPFSHFQSLLEQKSQLFHERCRDARQESRRQARERRHGQMREGIGWNSRDSDGSVSISSGDEEEMKEERDSSSDSEDANESEESSGDEGESEEESVVESVASSLAAANGNRPDKREETPFGRSSSINVFSTTTRDALTQATLMQDQGQQTSVSETRVASSLGFATNFARAMSEVAQEKDEGVGEAFVPRDKNEDPLAGRGKWSLSFQSVDPQVMTPIKASANSNSVASSSSPRSYVDSEELTRLRCVHHQSDNRCNQSAEMLREAESQTTPTRAPTQPIEQQSTKDHEKKEKAVVYHQEPSSQKTLTPLPLPHSKPQTWELDLSNFNA